MNIPDLHRGKAYLLFEMPDGAKVAYLLQPGVHLSYEVEYESSFDSYSVLAAPAGTRTRIHLDGILDHGQMWEGLDSPSSVL